MAGVRQEAVTPGHRLPHALQGRPYDRLGLQGRHPDEQNILQTFLLVKNSYLDAVS